MNPRIWSEAKFALFLLVLFSLAVGAWPSATQKSTVRGVTVAVTAGNLGEDAGMWDFAVAFHSDGRPLQDEMLENVVLVADGHRAKPIAWEGEGPKARGTHRAGVLKFIALRPRPKIIELHMQRASEPRPRVFRWEFGDWVALN